MLLFASYKTLCATLWCVIPVLALCGCKGPATRQSITAVDPPLHRFEAKSSHMGTLFFITLYATNQAAADAAAEAAFRRIHALEERLSDYRADSELNLLCTNAPGVPVPISAELFDILSKSLAFAKATDGAFDPTVGPFVRLWRFSRKRHTLPAAAEVESARQASGWRKLKLDAKTRTATLLTPNMRLDLGGIAKGYAADEALKALESFGIKRAIVAASGDIAVGKAPPDANGWKVDVSGLSSPLRRPLLLENAAISTSGDTEQSIVIDGVRYSHIVDARTGLGLTNRVQATVLSRRAITTDALGTALCVAGPERGLKIADAAPGTAALIITQENGQVKVQKSKRWAKLAKEADEPRSARSMEKR